VGPWEAAEPVFMHCIESATQVNGEHQRGDDSYEDD